MMLRYHLLPYLVVVCLTAITCTTIIAGVVGLWALEEIHRIAHHILFGGLK